VTANLLPRPARSRRQALLTMADVVDRILLMEEINPSEAKALARAVDATKAAMRNFVSYSLQGFRYYHGRSKVILPGVVSLGTITVSAGEITTSETLPDWNAYGHVQVGDKYYPVTSGNADPMTVDDLPDGSYTANLVQLFLPLPDDFRRRGSLSDSRMLWPIEDMSASTLQCLQDYFSWVNVSGSSRSFAAVTIDQRFQGALMLGVYPPYLTRTELSLFYERYPSPLVFHRDTGALVGVDGTTVTAASASFKADHLGATISIGVDDDIEMTKPLSDPSLVEAQRVITEVVSGVEVKIDQPVSSTAITDRRFYVSDVVDVKPGPMSEAFLRLAEYELLRQSKREAAPKKYQEFLVQMNLCMADDIRYDSAVDGQWPASGGVQWGEVNGRPG